jgi:type IV pilus assembly protein PilA
MINGTNLSCGYGKVSLKNIEIVIKLWLRDRRFMKTRNPNLEGFTLIELLVVIVIVGILAAIAVPTFLNQTSKAKQTEAKAYTSTINHAQQAYYTEKATFASLSNLALGFTPDNDNYTYTVSTTSTSAIANAASKINTLKAYAGQVYVYSDVIGNSVSISIVCEALNPSAVSITTPTAGVCAAGSINVQ